MKVDLGVKPYLFPMPVLLVATYSADGSVNVMNMAWGQICARNMVSLKINERHKTSQNLKERGAFTLSLADEAHLEAADFFGIASGNIMPDKFARSGLTAVRSEKVDAPVIQEFQLTLECRVVKDKMTPYGHMILGVLAEQTVLDESGNVDPTKLRAVGQKIGQAWSTGAALAKK